VAPVSRETLKELYVTEQPNREQVVADPSFLGQLERVVATFLAIDDLIAESAGAPARSGRARGPARWPTRRP